MITISKNPPRKKRGETPTIEVVALPSPPTVERDRVIDIERQILHIDHLLKLAEDRDLQGIARLMGTRRGLAEDLRVELERREQVSTSGNARELEEALVAALAEVDEDRLARVLGEVSRRRGRDLASLIGGE
jgi:hypothetical protein